MTRKLSDVLKAASARPWREDGRGRLVDANNRQIVIDLGVSLGSPSAWEHAGPNGLLLAHAANQIEGLMEAAQAVVYGYVKSKAVGPDDAQIEGRIENLRSALAKATTVDL